MQHLRRHERLQLSDALIHGIILRTTATVHAVGRFMTMPYLQSAAIETIAYDETTHHLRAKFRGDGRVVVYEDVPQEVYDALIFADSISEFFRDRIEGVYPARETRESRANNR